MERFAPIRCRKCGTVIGVIHGASFEAAKKILWMHPIRCPGRNQHARPEYLVTERFFGMIEHRESYYPETRTGWFEFVYCGRPSRICLFLAMLFGVDRDKRSKLKIVQLGGKNFVWDADLLTIDGWRRSITLFSQLFRRTP
ncbi:MAG TPA: hypothetical protein VLB83_04460 [Candidatus Paceibacterota bacterium]|nr:hypothetical protein [Candidatus Paceibacterota bacterium]